MDNLQYSFLESYQLATRWIQDCATCVDGRSCRERHLKACIFCTRNPYAPSGEEKRDWYYHFTDKETRDREFSEWLEKKKQLYRDQQLKRQEKKNS